MNVQISFLQRHIPTALPVSLSDTSRCKMLFHLDFKNRVHILEMMTHNSVLLCKANGESMKNQVSTVQMKVKLSILLSVNEAGSVLCV